MASSAIIAPIGNQDVNGWVRLGNGLLIQWGTVLLSASNGFDFSGTGSFPIAFSSVFTCLATSPTTENATDSRLLGQIRVAGITTTTFSVTCRNNVNAQGVAILAQYLAIGI